MSKHKEIRSGKNKSTRIYDRQRYRTLNNKHKYWEKHLAKNPNDEQAKIAISKLLKVEKDGRE
jgi:hypothetical protein